ncbi:MAG: hypothetical protein ACTSXP_17805 [Promethearchaeota archaeon]
MMISPGKITNIWGRSGIGKTILALNLAIHAIQIRKKVIFFTSKTGSFYCILSQLRKSSWFTKDVENNLSSLLFTVQVDNFKEQVHVIRDLDYLYVPRRNVHDSDVYREKINVLDPAVDMEILNSFDNYEAPSLLIFDDFSWHFRQNLVKTRKSELLGKDFTMIMAFLKKITRIHNTIIVLINQSRVMINDKSNNLEDRFVERPVADKHISYWVDIDIHLFHGKKLGTRMLRILDKDKKTEVLKQNFQLAELF